MNQDPRLRPLRPKVEVSERLDGIKQGLGLARSMLSGTELSEMSTWSKAATCYPRGE